MRHVLMARPQWQGSDPQHAALHADPRLIAAPLQELELCTPARGPLQALQAAAAPWLLLTSPASVQALAQWMLALEINLFQITGLRIAAVGAGTRQELADVFAHDPASTFSKALATDSSPAAADLQQVVTSGANEKADARSLLVALDDVQRQEQFAWRDQTFLLVQGEDNRPTLHDGLSQRKAKVIDLIAYRRRDIDWPAARWADLAACTAGDYGVVVTSTAMADRLVKLFNTHAIPPEHVVWCTQHAAIADRIKQHGMASVRRVRLNPKVLVHDLFDPPQYW